MATFASLSFLAAAAFFGAGFFSTVLPFDALEAVLEAEAGALAVDISVWTICGWLGYVTGVEGVEGVCVVG